MANTYKDIIITPNKGSNTSDPKIEFRAANSTTNADILVYVSPDDAGTLSFKSIYDSLASISANTDKILTLGNSTSNVVVNAVAVKFSNSSANLTINIPSTTISGATNYFLHANGSWVQVNSSSNVALSNSPPSSPNEGNLWWDTDIGRLLIYYNSQWIEAETPSGANTEIQFNDSGAFGSDSNLLYNKLTDTLSITNSSANVRINPSSIHISNSTSNTILTIPTTTAWSATNYFLHANGSWVQVIDTDTNTTYVVNSASNTTSGNIVLTPSSGSNTEIKLLGSGATTVSSDGTNITISSTDNNTTYTVNSASNTTSANIILKPSSGSNTEIKILGSGATTVSSDGTNITISSTDTAPAGNQFDIQYNSGSSTLAANAQFEFDPATPIVTVGNTTSTLAPTVKIINATGNSTLTTISYGLANATVTSNLQVGQLNIGANASLSTVRMLLGTSTANSQANATMITVANSTGNVQIVPAQINVGTALFINSTAFGANATSFLDTSKVSFGNSTQNTIINHTSGFVSIANASANISLTLSPSFEGMGRLFIGNSTVNTVMNTAVISKINTVVFRNLDNPTTAPTAVASESGGTLGPGTYYFRITGADESFKQTEFSPESTGVTIAGSTGSIQVTWNAIPGAVYYYVYPSTTSNGISETAPASFRTQSNTTGNTYSYTTNTGIAVGSIKVRWNETGGTQSVSATQFFSATYSKFGRGGIWVGNTATAYAYMCSNSEGSHIFVGNTTSNVVANVGARFAISNSTGNVQITTSQIKIQNSTSNTTISIPSTVAYSATNYFLHANGSWVQVSGGGGGYTESTSAPVSPSVGDSWLNTNTGVFYTYINGGSSNVWVELGPYEDYIAVYDGGQANTVFRKTILNAEESF